MEHDPFIDKPKWIEVLFSIPLVFLILVWGIIRFPLEVLGFIKDIGGYLLKRK
jgi:uncharacterized membrane protein YhdT